MALIRQGAGFIVVGGLQLLLDWLVFVLLSAVGVPIAAANVLARANAALVGFWLNGRYTFAQGGQPRLGGRRLLRFVLTWGVLTLISTLLIRFVSLHVSLHLVWLAKPLVEAVLAALSFLIARYWIYR